MIFDDSVNTDKYHLFLKLLRRKYPFRKMIIYCDNLGLHKSGITMEKYKELGFEVIFNPAYTPEANPIEFCFSIVKRQYRKLKAQNIALNKGREHRDMIKEAF